MSEAAILILDIGTSQANGVVFNASGEEILVKEHTIPLYTPSPGCVEQHPEQIWTAVLAVLGSLSKQLSNRYTLRGVGLSTQGGSIFSVSARWEPTDNLIPWMDQRGSAAIQSWEQDQLSRIRQISGWKPQPGLPLPVITAWRKSHPDRFEQTAHFLSLNDFIIWKLTGQLCTNPSMAGETLLPELQTGEYSQELCDMAGNSGNQMIPKK